MSEHDTKGGDVCGIMSVPPNTEWIEQSNSKLEMTCTKRRNQLSLGSLGNLSFMAVPNFPVKDILHYKDKILKFL